MKSYPNIEKSGFHKGQYVGYGGGYVWRIAKSFNKTWYARNTYKETVVIYAPTLESLSEKLANLPNRETKA